MRHLLSLTALVGATMFSAPAFAQGLQPAPGTIKIKSASFLGAGCSGATASVSPDNTQLQVLYPNFFVAHTGQVGKTQTAAANCTARLRMTVPVGYQVAIVSGTAQGQAILDAQVTGSVNVRYGFNLLGALVNSSTMTIPGPYANNYSHNYDMKLRSLSWSPCSGNERDLLVNTIMSVKTVGATSGIMTHDSADYKVKDEFGLIYRQCTAKPPKAVVAVCRASFTAAGKTNEVLGHSAAATAALATSQAQSRALTRCDNRSSEIGGSACSVPVNACQTLSL